MLKVYDKAQWHIDAGEDLDLVLLRFEVLFEFLRKNELLKEEGLEILNLGIDSSISCHERMLNDNGKRFMCACYDKLINYEPSQLKSELDQEYDNFLKKNMALQG